MNPDKGLEYELGPVHRLLELAKRKQHNISHVKKDDWEVFMDVVNTLPIEVREVAMWIKKKKEDIIADERGI